MDSTGRSGVVAGGNWIVDTVRVIDHYPAEETLANILHEESGNGGAPYNLLIDLAKLGVDFPLEGIGLVGNDKAGRGVIAHCNAHRIHTGQLRATDSAPTSYTEVMTVEGTGKRTFFHRRGANALLDETDFDFSETKAKIFHLGYLLLLDRLDRETPEGTPAADVLRRARQAGLIASLDVVSEDSTRFTRLLPPALRECDYCFMNEFEAERTTGVSLMNSAAPNSEALVAAADKLIRYGVRRAAVIHFAAGAFALEASGRATFQPSVNLMPAEIKGAVGAGDAFAAGFLYGVHEGLPVPECLRYGVCVAAACLTDPTTSGGIRPLTECLALDEDAR